MSNNNFPQCEGKVNWIEQNWKTNAYYSQNGVDGSERSIRRYLGNVEKKFVHLYLNLQQLNVII